MAGERRASRELLRSAVSVAGEEHAPVFVQPVSHHGPEGRKALERYVREPQNR